MDQCCVETFPGEVQVHIAQPGMGETAQPQGCLFTVEKQKTGSHLGVPSSSSTRHPFGRRQPLLFIPKDWCHSLRNSVSLSLSPGPQAFLPSLGDPWTLPRLRVPVCLCCECDDAFYRVLSSIAHTPLPISTLGVTVLLFKTICKNVQIKVETENKGEGIVTSHMQCCSPQFSEDLGGLP